MRRTLVVLATWLLPHSVLGQRAPGTNLVVDVHVTSIAMRGDTTRVQYRLHNHAESSEELYTFTVDAPAPIINLSLPEPASDWDTARVYRGRSVADWTALGRQMAPGADGPDMYLEAVGLPGTVTAWVRGYYPPPRLAAGDTAPTAPPSDPLLTNSVRLVTVGVLPKPADASPIALLTRLRALAAASCDDLGWISSAGVCASLEQKIDSAATAFGAGRFGDARGLLRALLQELDAQRGTEPGKHVSDNAYWLLQANAAYALTHLQ